MNKHEKTKSTFYEHSTLFQMHKNYLFQTFIPKYKNIDDNPLMG